MAPWGAMPGRRALEIVAAVVNSPPTGRSAPCTSAAPPVDAGHVITAAPPPLIARNGAPAVRAGSDRSRAGDHASPRGRRATWITPARLHVAIAFPPASIAIRVPRTCSAGRDRSIGGPHPPVTGRVAAWATTSPPRVSDHAAIAVPSAARSTDGSTTTPVPTGETVSGGEKGPEGPRVADRTR